MKNSILSLTAAKYWNSLVTTKASKLHPREVDSCYLWWEIVALAINCNKCKSSAQLTKFNITLIQRSFPETLQSISRPFTQLLEQRWKKTTPNHSWQQPLPENPTTEVHYQKPPNIWYLYSHRVGTCFDRICCPALPSSPTHRLWKLNSPLSAPNFGPSKN